MWTLCTTHTANLGGPRGAVLFGPSCRHHELCPVATATPATLTAMIALGARGGRA